MSIEKELQEKLDKVLENAPENRHSYFQIQFFIIGKEPTVQAKMWQCLRELQLRRDSIDSINLEVDEAKDNMELIDIDIQMNQDSKPKPSGYKRFLVETRMRQRQKARLAKSVEGLKQNLKFVYQESRFFLQLLDKLQEIEPLKDYDDLDAQKDYWNHKLAEEINLRMLMHQPIDTEMAKMVLALPEDVSIKVDFEKHLYFCKEAMTKSKKLLEGKNE